MSFTLGSVVYALIDQSTQRKAANYLGSHVTDYNYCYILPANIDSVAIVSKYRVFESLFPDTAEDAFEMVDSNGDCVGLVASVETGFNVVDPIEPIAVGNYSKGDNLLVKSGVHKGKEVQFDRHISDLFSQVCELMPGGLGDTFRVETFRLDYLDEVVMVDSM